MDILRGRWTQCTREALRVPSEHSAAAVVVTAAVATVTAVAHHRPFRPFAPRATDPPDKR